jgi:hypothetical protein
MGYSYLLVNHTKKQIVLIDEMETMWQECMRLLKCGWNESDNVDTMHEMEDYHKLRSLVIYEHYAHTLGDEVFR